MLTMETLKAYGANTAEGLERCMGNEAFYLRMVKMAAQDGNVQKLAQALGEGNLDAAFEAAHALKGVWANLALTPLLTPVMVMTEDLRARKQMDYSAGLAEIQSAWAALQALVEG